jgi:hypothetical protein
MPKFGKKTKGKSNSTEEIEANAGGFESNNIASVLVLATLRYVCVGNMDLCGCQLNSFCRRTEWWMALDISLGFVVSNLYATASATSASSSAIRDIPWRPTLFVFCRRRCGRCGTRGQTGRKEARPQSKSSTSRLLGTRSCTRFPVISQLPCYCWYCWHLLIWPNPTVRVDSQDLGQSLEHENHRELANGVPSEKLVWLHC